MWKIKCQVTIKLQKTGEVKFAPVALWQATTVIVRLTRPSDRLTPLIQGRACTAILIETSGHERLRGDSVAEPAASKNTSQLPVESSPPRVLGGVAELDLDSLSRWSNNQNRQSGRRAKSMSRRSRLCAAPCEGGRAVGHGESTMSTHRGRRAGG